MSELKGNIKVNKICEQNKHKINIKVEYKAITTHTKSSHPYKQI